MPIHPSVQTYTKDEKGEENEQHDEPTDLT